MLQQIMDKQKAFMFVIHTGNSIIGRLDDLVEASQGMVIESAEVLDEFNKAHRNWKRPMNFEHIAEEAIDVLFYLTELLVLLELDANKVAEIYTAKLAFNLCRIIEAETTAAQREKIERMIKVSIDTDKEDLQKLAAAIAQSEHLPFSVALSAIQLMENHLFCDVFFPDADGETEEAALRWRISPVSFAREILNDVLFNAVAGFDVVRR